MANYIAQLDLDLSFLEEIADGSDEFIVESIDMFLSQTPVMLETISKGIIEQNWTKVASASHKLKPNLGFFGMKKCQEVFQEIETIAKEGRPDTQELFEMYKDIDKVLTISIAQLEKIRAEKVAGL